MGINLQNKLLGKLSTLLMLLALSVSCLPVQKKTQCSESEAFNASKRQCVPVIGASTSNTVFIGSKSPQNSYSASVDSTVAITHTVAVSDVYNYGYTVKWFVHKPGTTTIIPAANDTVTFNFIPSQQSTAGQYIIEAILFDSDGVNQLDSSSWNVSLESKTSPSLVSATPANAFTHYNTQSTASNYLIDIYSPESVGGSWFAYLDGTLISNGNITTSTDYTNVSLSITPSTLTNGLHDLTIKVHNGTSTSDPLFDSYSWIVNIVNPDYPVVLPLDTETVPNISQTISVVDQINMASSGWTYTLPDNSTGTLTELCVNTDKVATTGNGIYVKFFVSGVATEIPTVQTSKKFCASAAVIDSYISTSFNLTNPDISEARSIIAKTYSVDNDNLIEALSWNVAVRPKNIRPIISIDTSNSNSMNCVTTSAVKLTSCTINQSVNVNIDSNDTDYLDTDDATESNLFEISLDYDPDIQSLADYEVVYQLKKVTDPNWQDVNMTGSSPDSSYTFSDCTRDETYLSTDKLTCDLQISAFNKNGPIESGDYELRAWIRDANTGLGFDVSPKESNIVSWDITVAERQAASSITIAPQTAATTYATIAEQAYYEDGLTSSNIKTESWISTSVGGAPVVNVKENDTVYINTVVRDVERDDFNISIAIDNKTIGAGKSTLVPTSVVNRTDYAEYSLHTVSVSIPEWVSKDTLTNNIEIEVTVQDRPESYTGICTTCATDSEIFLVNVENDNPTPSFADFSDVDLSAAGAGYKVFAGVAFEIPVLTSHFNDTSLYDGANIEWKWQISKDGGTWVDIPNADSTNQTLPALTWTPNLDIPVGTIIDLRLCLGDDGTNDINVANSNPDHVVNASNNHDCTYSTADATAEGFIKQWRNIEVFPVNKRLARSETTDHSSGNEVYQWYDETAEYLYTTYISGLNIIVEKSQFNPTTKVFESVHSISFPTEDTNAGDVPVTASELSIDGIDNTAIVIAYKVFTSPSSIPEMRVRRIHTGGIDVDNADGDNNITTGIELSDIKESSRLAFNYCGTYATGTCDTNNLDLYVAGSLEAHANTTINSASTGQFSIYFSGTLTGDEELILKTNAGETITYKYGDQAGITTFDPTSHIVEYCVGGCISAGTTIEGLANAINATYGDPEIDAVAQEFYAHADTTSDTITIYGPAEKDYYNNDKVSPYIGNIQVKTDGTWFVPFVDVSNFNKISMAIGNNSTSPLGFISDTTQSNVNINDSDINNQQIHSKLVTGSIYLAVKNSTADLDVIKVGDTAATLNNSVVRVSNIYSPMTGFSDIDNVKIDVGETVANSYVYVSTVNIGNSGATRNLGLNIFTTDLATNMQSNSEITALGYSEFVSEIDQAQVIVDPNNAGTSFIAITTTPTNTNPSRAYLIKADFNTADFTSNFNFHEHQYPQLNSEMYTIAHTSKIHATMIPSSFTINASTNIGHTTAALTTPTGVVAEDATLNPIFFAFHESDSNSRVRIGLYNTDESQVTSKTILLDSGTSTPDGSAPAIIGN